MSSLSDEALARILQAEFDEEYQGGGNVTVSTRNTSDSTQVSPYSSMPSGSSSSSNSKPLSLIDREWELLDPTPDPRALFLQFNDKFFSGRLAGVEVRWSPRMTLCAGVCSYEGRGGLCSIRLSVPLLKLRPRKDLVETLLHEMIHAYLFVTQNNRDRDGHGPEFCKHKDRINKEAGTKITIYHSFHDEVENYRQHWWRCNGPCQERKPFFGYVKRAMNRAPSHNDTWWADHQRNCGGTFTKIKEPEGYSNKKRKKEANSKEETENETPEKKPKRESHDIRNFIPFGGQGQRLGGSDSKKVNGTSAGETYKPDVVEKENKNPALERGASHEGREQIRRKTLSNNDLGAGVGGSLVKNETDISPTSKANDKDHMQKTYNTKVKRKDSLKNCPNGKDIERRKKKLEELKAIFVSSSDDEDDENVDAYQEERKAGKAKEGVRKVSAVGCGGEAGIERSEDDGARERRKKMGGKDGEWLDGRTSSFSVPSVSGVRSGVGGAVGGAQVIDRGRNRGSSGKDTRDHSSGQNSLHQVVEKMKRVPGVTSGSSQGDAERTSGNEQPTVCCPVCGTRVTESQINGHLDSCLSG